MSQRYASLDLIRGIAVVLMVIFHTCFDLTQLGFAQWDFQSGFFFWFPRLIVFLFLFCVGAGVQLAHGSGRKNSRAFWRRWRRLVIFSLAISVITWVIFREQWVFFGTLHCITIASLFAWWVLGKRTIQWLLLAIIGIPWALGYDTRWVNQQIGNPLSLDFIPVYPWFFVVLVGMIAVPHWVKRLGQIGAGAQPILWLGQNSLWIYLLHQPIIYGVLTGFRVFLSR